jgi:large subunit ribosomal protein L22
MDEMQAIAHARFMRLSTQKARWVAAVVKGNSVEKAIDILKFMPQKSAAVIGKVVQSAAANAEQKGGDIDRFKVTNIIVNQGPSLKRFRPRAQGRANRILKPMSHITVILED